MSVLLFNVFVEALHIGVNEDGVQTHLALSDGTSNRLLRPSCGGKPSKRSLPKSWQRGLAGAVPQRP